MSVFDGGIGSAWSTRNGARASGGRGLGPSRRGAGVAAFVLAICTAGALVHVAVRIKGLEVAYDLGRERRIATEMEEQRRRLQIEIGMLKDPGRVISIAREQLNMGPPTPEAIWRLGAGAPAAANPGATAEAGAAPREGNQNKDGDAGKSGKAAKAGKVRRPGQPSPSSTGGRVGPPAEVKVAPGTRTVGSGPAARASGTRAGAAPPEGKRP